MKLALAVLVIAAAVLPSAQAGDRNVVPRDWPTFRTDGVSIRYPKGWHATARRLTNVISPPMRFAITSYPLRQRGPGSTCAPTHALAEMPADGAFIYAIEYVGATPHGFPPHPTRFRLTRFSSYECMGPSYGILFRDAGRFFQIHVSVGKHAGPRLRATVPRVLDSFHAKRI